MNKMGLGYGCFAYCCDGKLGLITSKKPDARGAWRGVNVKTGKSWQSRNPVMVGYLETEKEVKQLLNVIDIANC